VRGPLDEDDTVGRRPKNRDDDGSATARAKHSLDDTMR
jgi:hypothetical protein